VNNIGKAALIFLGAAALYFFTRSPALDEHDSIQLALGVLDFNMWKDQPHAPGYPVFIFLGWAAKQLFGIGPELSFHLLSAFGGGLFVAMWFLIVRAQFNERLAWWAAFCLALVPAVWMTATKALTDSLAAGFLSAQIYAALHLAALHLAARPRPLDGFKPFGLTNASGTWALVISALCGAAAAGVRPQLVLVTIVVLITALIRARASAKLWFVGAGAFLVACLLWLVPMNFTQWRLHPELSFWSVFPRLAYHQWQWRLDKPGVYLGAGDWSPKYLLTRAVFHFLGWFGLGFGLIKSIPVFVVGVAIVLTGLTLYLTRARRWGDATFWRWHAPWALTHVVIIFISLSPAQRYYLLVFPLLLVVLLRGYLQLPSPWNAGAALLPILLLSVAVPLALDNHRDPPPALRLVRFVGRLYPESRRGEVVLLFNKVRRHAEWYTPGFVTIHDVPPDQLIAQTSGAAAVYTDDAKAPLPAGWRRVPLAIFMRSGIIYWKHHAVELYLIDRSGHG
jgi:hypothetical protein